MKVELTKQLFIESMISIREYYNLLDKIEEVLQADLCESGLYEIFTRYIATLETLCNNDIISYFIWDLEWGKNWKHGCVTDKNGNDIKLQTLNDLWKYIENERN